MSSREEQKAETRQKILDAATQLLLSSNFESFNTKDVAEQANVAKGSVFHHFGSKSNLIVQVIIQITKKQMKESHVINIEDEDPADVLRNFTKSQIDMIHEQSHLITLIIQQISEFNKENMEQIQDSFVKFMNDTFYGFVDLFTALGWSQEDLPSAIQLYFSILDGMGLQQEFAKYLPPDNIFDFDGSEHLLDTIVDLFDKR